MLTRRGIINGLRYGLLGCLVVIIVTYAIWRSLNYAKGPAITVIKPENGSGSASTTIAVTGIAERIKDISINGRNISMEESGKFSEIIIIFPGVNIITLLAHDQFNRSLTKEIYFVGLSTTTFQEIHAEGNPSSNASSSALNNASSTKKK